MQTSHVSVPNVSSFGKFIVNSHSSGSHVAHICETFIHSWRLQKTATSRFPRTGEAFTFIQRSSMALLWKWVWVLHSLWFLFSLLMQFLLCSLNLNWSFPPSNELDRWALLNSGKSAIFDAPKPRRIINHPGCLDTFSSSYLALDRNAIMPHILCNGKKIPNRLITYHFLFQFQISSRVL